MTKKAKTQDPSQSQSQVPDDHRRDCPHVRHLLDALLHHDDHLHVPGTRRAAQPGLAVCHLLLRQFHRDAQPLIYGAFHLRSRKRPHSKSTSFYNNSSTSRIDNTLMTTFRRSHPRKSHEELAGQQANGNLTVPGTSHRRERRSMVMDLNNSIRVVPKNHKSSF
ncbi:g_PROTEIN_RECEP_F1_2 domain-containing protein [Caerostris extrusa]|uniref:G_PROTEIN_RECEP_F1_2 domain-containing protein n=1 Tax=Caerostris extrusa TaxID=172846 RepID=A0AAV4M5D6_CAEEX|nr:g_PROTEIN_RECEP_F1_2 domain-containing protein [Caerostris extrusa]